MAENLNITPFPPLVWDTCYWAGEVNLSSWAWFQSRRGPYTSISSDDGSDGSIRLYLATENEKPIPPSAEEIRAFQYLLDNERLIRDSIVNAIFDGYPGLREAYDVAFDDEEIEELMPAIERAEQLRTLIGLSNIHVLTVATGGVAYIGFEFGCTWDEEHGLGVMTHQDRVIKIGQADTSFDGWAAKGDAESRP